MPSAAANDGGSPWRTACAPRTIMLPAAWRKMCVSSATGTGARRDELGERLAGADRRELVGVADEHDVRARADRAQQRDEQLEVGHRGLVDDQQVGVESRRRVGPWPGIQPSAEWIVEASSAGRLGHPPRGAAGRRDEQRPRRSAASAAAQIRRIVAVLPVPGPPVTIESRCANAARTAAACSGAGTRSSRAGAARAPRAHGRRRGRPRRARAIALGELRLERRGPGR